MTEVTTRHDPDRQRYEAVVDGEPAGFAAYELQDGLVVFTHTVVDDAFEGQGVGSQLARDALDDVRREGSRQVVPMCSFIKGWIEAHPDYADLVVEDPGRG
jgi:predicted GNAT family acetyltransferase